MKSKKATLFSSLGVLFAAIAIFFLFRWIVIEPYVIPSGSMIPTLLVNDHILVSKFDYGVRLPFSKIWLLGPSFPARGDVVVFESVEDSNMMMIKRVVGLPGDKFYINSEGEILTSEPEDVTSVDVVEVEEGHLYLMGDNRRNSRDSRYWGALPIQNIVGRARAIWLSCDQTLSKVDSLCDPRYMHWDRMFTHIK